MSTKKMIAIFVIIGLVAALLGLGTGLLIIKHNNEVTKTHTHIAMTKN